MLYRRNTRLKPPVVRTFKLNAFGGYVTGVGENTLSLSQSKYCLNYVARDGELTQAYGTRSAKLDFETGLSYPIPRFSNNVSGVYQYEYSNEGTPDDRLLVHLSNGELYCLYVDRDDRDAHLLATSVWTIHGAFSYRLGSEDVMIIASNSGFYILRDDKLELVENAPDVRHFCLHRERAFGATESEPYKLWFTSNLDPSDWTVSPDGGGYIEFSKDNGRIKRVVSFLGYVYVFREYGIERISTYADQTDFEVLTIYSSTDRLYHNTVTVCGEKIVFLSEKGLHVFDGVNVNKISGIIEPEDFRGKGDKAVATYYKGNYMLSVYVKRFDDDKYKNSEPRTYSNNCIVCMSLDDGVVSVMSEYDVINFCVYKSTKGSNLIMVLHWSVQKEYMRIMMLDEEKCARIGSVTYYYWQTGMTDLGYPEKKKMLESITIAIKGTAVLSVMLDDVEIELGRIMDGQNTFRVMRNFERFGFKLTGYGYKTQRVSPPVIKVSMR